MQAPAVPTSLPTAGTALTGEHGFRLEGDATLKADVTISAGSKIFIDGRGPILDECVDQLRHKDHPDHKERSDDLLPHDLAFRITPAEVLPLQDQGLSNEWIYETVCELWCVRACVRLRAFAEMGAPTSAYWP